ncbi:MAG: bacteriocin [Ilumatobacteraceae bacterium]|nr:bacteriocin [Ilumatobacteraceae bacterium]
MNHLLRELAPISDAAWTEIDGEATRTLAHFFAARKLVDFEGPLGYATSAVSLGRLQRVGDQPADGVTANRRQLLPLLELRRPFTLLRSELESVDRGACDADLDPLIDACRAIAMAEDTLVFTGNASADIVGIVTASPHAPIPLTDEFDRYPNRVAQAVATLKAAGIGGPYAIALGPRCYAGVIETTEKGGFPLLQHLALILGGPVIWAPAVDGAVVLSQRGGDFELTVGQDTSIAYRDHTSETVTLELQETATFVAPTPAAAIALQYSTT